MGRMAQRGRVRPLTRRRSAARAQPTGKTCGRHARSTGSPAKGKGAPGSPDAPPLSRSDRSATAYCSALSVIAVVKAPASGALVIAGFSGLTAASSASTVALKSAGSSAPFDPAVSFATSPII